jgi:hypothetical protein
VDRSNRHEYVVFSESARKAEIPQYLDNRQVYGYIAFGKDSDQFVGDGIARVRTLLAESLANDAKSARRNATRPRVIACFGQHGSGSTWLFNLMRDICKAQSIPFLSMHHDSASRLPWDAPSEVVIIAKSQSPAPSFLKYIARSPDPVVMTVRDPRDAVVSFMQRFPNSFAQNFDQALKAIALSADRLMAVSRLREVLVFRYEDGFVGSESTADCIAGLLGTALSSDQRRTILADLSPEAVRKKISDLEKAEIIQSETVWDRATHWHRNHVGDGKIGKWRDALTQAQEREILDRTRDYCERFGYGAVESDSNALAPVESGKRPRVFSCFGLHSSGSTWMFNLAREICKAGSVPFVSAHRDSSRNLPWDAPGAQLIVAKTHNPMADFQNYVAESGDPVVLTVRDPRDAVVSFMQRFSNSAAKDFEQALDAIAFSAQRLVKISRLSCVPIFRYEDGFIGAQKTVDRISHLLGVVLTAEQSTAILAGLSREAVREKIGTLEKAGVIRSEEVWDRETHWHMNHVGDGSVGKWREALTPEQAREILDRTKEFCETFGYTTA